MGYRRYRVHKRYTGILRILEIYKGIEGIGDIGTHGIKMIYVAVADTWYTIDVGDI